MPHQSEPVEPVRPAPLSVVVARSGGFAGLTRQWRVEAAAGESRTWTTLIDRCPWPPEARSGAVGAPPAGADRFAWTVSVHCGRDRRRAELAEHEVDGPWKALIDAVRAEGAAARAKSVVAPPEQ